MTVLLLILLGLIAGLLSGLVGIGGGVVIVPALVFFFHYSQKLAQGTTLALLIPPIGILAVMTYFKAGDVNIKAAAWIICGFVIGGYFGAKLVTHLPEVVVARAFGAFLLVLAVKFLFFPK
jgi:uncharacterized membrane protein YfcA